MKFNLVVSLLALTVISAPAEDPGVFKDEKDKVSYAIGVNIGDNFRARSLELNPAMVAKGMQEAYAGSKTLLTTNEMRETLMAFQQKQALKVQAQASAAGEKAKTEGLAYQASNKKKEGVKVLPVTVEGKPAPVELQYKVLKEGTGASPKATDTVKVNYRGTLPDGKVFDSSYDRNEPATFPVNGVIKGWTEALQHMKPGGKWEICLPPELAYGERGAGNDIPPNATLIFTVELLSIEKQ